LALSELCASALRASVASNVMAMIRATLFFICLSR